MTSHDVQSTCNTSVYNISDEQAEFQIADRLSFQKFLGIESNGKIPDYTTIWLFRERLKEHKLMEPLFELFGKYLHDHGYVAMKGQIADASFVQVPRQRNTREENQKIKDDGKAPEEWSDNKKPHTDTDASWTQKRNVNYFGYKNHVSTDCCFGFIRKYAVTPSNPHDSQALLDLLDSTNSSPEVWDDSAYTGAQLELQLNDRGFRSMICEKGYRDHPFTDEQKDKNVIIYIANNI